MVTFPHYCQLLFATFIKTITFFPPLCSHLWAVFSVCWKAKSHARTSFPKKKSDNLHLITRSIQTFIFLFGQIGWIKKMPYHDGLAIVCCEACPFTYVTPDNHLHKKTSLNQLFIQSEKLSYGQQLQCSPGFKLALKCTFRAFSADFHPEGFCTQYRKRVLYTNRHTCHPGILLQMYFLGKEHWEMLPFTFHLHVAVWAKKRKADATAVHNNNNYIVMCIPLFKTVLQSTL